MTFLIQQSLYLQVDLLTCSLFLQPCGFPPLFTEALLGGLPFYLLINASSSGAPAAAQGRGAPPLPSAPWPSSQLPA